MSKLLSSLSAFFRQGEKRISSQEFEHAVNQVLLSDTVADATKKQVITPEGSLAISAVWACVRILSETVGTLPIHLYQKTPTGREEAKGHPCSTILSKPNSYLTRFGLLHHLMIGCTLWGNGYARIHRDRLFRPVRLQLLQPYECEPILTVASLLSAIDSLADLTGTGTSKRITFGARNKAKLSAAQPAQVTDKGWVLG